MDYPTLNLRRPVYDIADTTLKNLQRLCKTVGLPYNKDPKHVLVKRLAKNYMNILPSFHSETDREALYACYYAEVDALQGAKR